jgi:hypothetical protein
LSRSGHYGSEEHDQRSVGSAGALHGRCFRLIARYRGHFRQVAIGDRGNVLVASSVRR